VTSLRRTADGIVISFDEVEASLLRHLVGEVRDLLDEPPGPPGAAGWPDDPAIRPGPPESTRGSAAGPPGRAGGPRSAGPSDGPDSSPPAGPAPYHRGGRVSGDRPGRDQGLPDDALLAELTGLGGPPPSRPEDPVLARLLPDGYRDDADAAGEFRRLTEASLREEKRRNALGVLADLPGPEGAEIRLDEPTVERWLAALNDVRLALGTRLDVAEDMPEPDPDDPDAPAYVVYLWLTGLQEILLGVADEG
jgi:hypothetical protein